MANNASYDHLAALLSLGTGAAAQPQSLPLSPDALMAAVSTAAGLGPAAAAPAPTAPTAGAAALAGIAAAWPPAGAPASAHQHGAVGMHAMAPNNLIQTAAPQTLPAFTAQQAVQNAAALRKPGFGTAPHTVHAVEHAKQQPRPELSQLGYAAVSPAQAAAPSFRGAAAGRKAPAVPAGARAYEPFPRTHLRECMGEGCCTKPSFGSPTEWVARYCNKHKLSGDVNVVSKKCEQEGCFTRPSFGDPVLRKAQFCTVHKRNGDVDVVNKRCELAGCFKQPSFAGECDRRARYCRRHKRDGDTNVINRRCEADDCRSRPSFGLASTGKAAWCARHRTAGCVRMLASDPPARAAAAAAEQAAEQRSVVAHSVSLAALKRPRCEFAGAELVGGTGLLGPQNVRVHIELGGGGEPRVIDRCAPASDAASAALHKLPRLFLFGRCRPPRSLPFVRFQQRRRPRVLGRILQEHRRSGRRPAAPSLCSRLQLTRTPPRQQQQQPAAARGTAAAALPAPAGSRADGGGGDSGRPRRRRDGRPIPGPGSAAGGGRLAGT